VSVDAYNGLHSSVDARAGGRGKWVIELS